MWYVYILECKGGTLYTGITNDVINRLKQHNSGKGAKYTRNKRPVELKYLKEMPDKSSAAKEEYRIKQLGRVKKLLLISSEKSNL